MSKKKFIESINKMMVQKKSQLLSEQIRRCIARKKALESLK